MTSELLSMGAGALIAALIGGGVQYGLFGALERRQKKHEDEDRQRDQDLKELTATVTTLKDDKVAVIEKRLDNNHAEHGALHEKINGARELFAASFVTHRELGAVQESLGREIGQLRKSISGLQATAADTSSKVDQATALTQLIANKLEVHL